MRHNVNTGNDSQERLSHIQKPKRKVLYVDGHGMWCASLEKGKKVAKTDYLGNNNHVVVQNTLR